METCKKILELFGKIMRPLMCGTEHGRKELM